jgi:serine/threonine protein phosphatase 1
MLERLRNLVAPRRDVAAAPNGVRIYAVGDIHGCAAELDRLLAHIVDDSREWRGECRIVYLGDYVDRGPDSKGVIERLLKPLSGFSTTCLRGNHDQVLLDFLDNPSLFRTWRDFGGRETLLSYGVRPPLFDDVQAYAEVCDQLRSAIPREHLEFLQQLPFFARIGGYYFVHAGVRNGVSLDEQTPEDMLWIRDEFLTSTDDFGAIVVHGHTPTKTPVQRGNRIGIDTGAYATGVLTAAVLEGSQCRFLGS